MKIIFILDNGKIGGTEKFIVSLAEKITEYGHEAAILILERDRKILEFAENKSVKFFFAIRRFKLDLVNFIAKIQAVLKEYNPQVIVATGLFSFFFIAASQFFLKQKAPVVVRFNDISALSFKARIFEFFYAIVLHIFRATFVALCPEQKMINARRFFLQTENIKIIPNGVDTEFYSRDKFKGGKPFIAKKNTLTVAHIASLKSLKRQQTIFKALKRFGDVTKNNWQLLIVGEGKPQTLKYYKKLLKKLRIEDKVFFLGVVKDVREILVLADVFVLSSRKEALPLSALEALSMGVPCILPRVGGCSHIIDEDTNGYLFDPGKYAQLADLLNKVYCHKELSRLKEGARQTAIKKFNLDDATKSFINLFKAEVTK